jgi:regulator of protease activity HflC (stomatin/prohibitin superfamily)
VIKHGQYSAHIPEKTKRIRDWTGVKLLFLVCSIVLTAAGLAVSGETGYYLTVAGAAMVVLVLVASSVKKANEWERMLVLRFGKFHSVRGPGLFFLLPVADRIGSVIDIRIRIMDFSAQNILTADSVTVNVDAFAFWLVWDPQKAALEVEDYEEAVALASKAGLRNAVCGNTLSVILEQGDLIENQIQAEVDKQTTAWGITVQYIEIHDIQMPEVLQESLALLAKAEREKKSRILLAEAEIEIAKKLEAAVSVYAGNEPAMKLKILSILNEGLKAGNSMMLIPNSIAEELKSGGIFGLEALSELRKK